MGSGPQLSIVVVVYDMPAQADRTLMSMAPGYQRGVTGDDYEVIVVENRSDRLLGERAARAHGDHVRYFLRDETVPSPVFAANFGAAQARGGIIALCIDGARLLTPGVVRSTLDVSRIATRLAVSTPGYHVGSDLHQHAAEQGYCESEEAELLGRIKWPEDGHRLFEVACLSGSCRGGLLRPFSESNFLAAPAAVFAETGLYDERFVSRGGGFCNLDLYRRVVERDDIRLIVLAGEGTFHQFHGGVTTGGRVGADRDAIMREARAEYERLLGQPWAPSKRPGEFFGTIPAAAHRFLVPASVPSTRANPGR